MVILFVVGFATGPGSIPWFFVTELFNQSARGMATSIAVVTNWSANFLVGLLFPPLQVCTFQIFYEKSIYIIKSLLIYDLSISARNGTLRFRHFHCTPSALHHLRILASARNEKSYH